jgi:multidrug efflux pump subunit AcrA (membrane-fusion protein)
MTLPEAGHIAEGDTPPFLDRNPPHWAARGLAYLLILLFLVAAVGSAVLHVPEVIAASFVLTPVAGSDPVRTPRRGIVSELRVREGQEVVDDETLAVIGSEDVGDRSGDLRGLETQLRGAADALDNARRKRESERLADLEEGRGLRDRITDVGRMVVLKQEQLTLKQQIVRGRQKLHAEGLTSSEDLAVHELEANQLTLELRQLEAGIETTRASLAKLLHQIGARAAEFTELERRLHEDVEKSEIRVAVLRGGPLHIDGGSVTVRAPCRGVILRLLVKARGAVVQEGDVISELACAGERLQAELSVPQTGVARVQVGQQVKLLYDAFPYQRFGVRYGTVRWISPGSVPNGEIAIFRVMVEPNSRPFTIDGQTRDVMPGMSGQAQIVVGSRTLLSYAWSPLRQLRESLSTPPDAPSR